jgi:hypothetical protein
MKKAVIVTAVVKTRIIIDEKDSFETIANKAKENLVRNLSNDLFDNIESVETDTEMPYGSMVKDYLEDFFVNGIRIISRTEYESLPCPLCSIEISDETMQKIANEVYNSMKVNYGKETAETYFKVFNVGDEDFTEEVNDFFWREMEEIALKNGMRYYDDMCEEEYLAIKSRK